MVRLKGAGHGNLNMPTVLKYRVKTTQLNYLLAANAVQGEAIGNLNISAVLEYRVKTKWGKRRKQYELG
jgi:hypothetical protein